MWDGREKGTMRKSLLFKFCFVLLMITIIGCGSDSSTLSSNTGSIAAHLDWSGSRGSAGIHSAAAPEGVVTVRIIVSGADMTDIQKNFPASDGQGQIDGVPAGSNRTVKAQGLNSDNSVTHEGSIGNVTVTAGQTTDVGTITMLPVTPQNQGTVAGTVRDTLEAPVAGVTVTLLQNGSVVATTTTGADGTFSLDAPAGNYTITFAKTGFQTASADITIVAGSTLTLDVTAVTVSNPTLPAGFPASVPQGNYRIDVEVCIETPQAIPCQTTAGVGTLLNTDISQFAQGVQDSFNQYAAMGQQSCTQPGGPTCTVSVSNVSYSQWDSNSLSFSVSFDFSVTIDGQTTTGSMTLTFTKIS